MCGSEEDEWIWAGFQAEARHCQKQPAGGKRAPKDGRQEPGTGVLLRPRPSSKGEAKPSAGFQEHVS